MQWLTNLWAKLTKREQILLTSGMLIILGVIFYFYLYQPQVKKLKQSRDNLGGIITSLKAKKTVLQQEKEVKQKNRKLIKELKQKQAKFLKEGQELDLVVNLNQLATKIEVGLLDISSSRIKNNKLSIQLQLQGSYQQLLNYIKNVEELEKLLLVDNLNITRIGKAKLEANLRLVAYFIEQGGTASEVGPEKN
ncbi:hypothetical protein JCM16358_22370 [Halanaerocella petrolearia]